MHAMPVEPCGTCDKQDGHHVKLAVGDVLEWRTFVSAVAFGCVGVG